MNNIEKHPEQLTWQNFVRSPLRFISLLKENRDHYKSVKETVDHVAGTVDPSIKNVRGYRKRLTPKILHCQAFCRKIVEQIPGPIDLDIQDYSSAPLMKAAFPGHDKISPILREAETFLTGVTEKETERVALLTMNHEEREFFGTAKHRQMVVGDAKLTSVTFSDHKIVGLATSLEKSRHRLENTIFDVIIETASHRLADHKEEYGELKANKEKLKAMLKMFGGQVGLQGDLRDETEEKLDKVKTLLQETENSLLEEKANVEMPEDRLEFLTDYLAQPEKVMDIKLISLRLDWRNVITQDSEESANTIQFAQCTIPSKIKRDAVLIAYSTEHLQ